MRWMLGIFASPNQYLEKSQLEKPTGEIYTSNLFAIWGEKNLYHSFAFLISISKISYLSFFDLNCRFADPVQ